MKLFAVRLKEGEMLKETIENIMQDNQFSSATVISAVGSLGKAVIRMAGAAPTKQDIRTYKGSFEVVSLIGNLGQGRTHLHIAISDKEGNVIGGHLKEGSIVHTTLELVLAVDKELIFTEALDRSTGFGELEVARSGN